MNNLFNMTMKVVTAFVATFILLFAGKTILDGIKVSDAKYQIVLECMASGKQHHECHEDAQ